MIQINDNMQQAFTEVREMLKTSTYRLNERKLYYYCKVKVGPKDLGKHFLVSKDEHEITVVTTDVEGLDLIEKNKNEWLLLDLKLSIPFMKGTILMLAYTIFNSDSNILVISTYSNDDIFIKRQDKDKVVEALGEIGLQRKV